MSLGNIVRGKTQYPRKGLVCLQAIFPSLKYVRMKLLGRFHSSFFESTALVLRLSSLDSLFVNVLVKLISNVSGF